MIKQWERQQIPNTSSHDQTKDIWKRVWKLRVIPKQAHLLWRFLTNTVPIRLNMHVKGVMCLLICPRCQQFVKSIDMSLGIACGPLISDSFLPLVFVLRIFAIEASILAWNPLYFKLQKRRWSCGYPFCMEYGGLGIRNASRMFKLHLKSQLKKLVRQCSNINAVV